MLKRKVKVLCVLLIAFLMMVPSTSAFAATTIEDTYKAAGSLQVSTQVVQVNGVDTYIIYYPSTLTGTNSYPIVVWGNGTNAAPDSYDSVLNHIASWGFVVIDSYSVNTGTGQEILDSALYIANQNSNLNSIFYQKLDVANLAAVGHSQGATGVVNASYRYPQSSIIKSLAAISLPADTWGGLSPEWIPDMSQVHVPTFFTKGDGLYDALVVGFSMTNHYNAMPAGVAAVKGVCIGTDHLEIHNAGGGKLGGYITAWLRYQLMHDSTAAGAFSGTNPEIKTNTGHWSYVETKNMP